MHENIQGDELPFGVGIRTIDGEPRSSSHTRSRLSEALKRGLQIEIDDGGRPLAPRAVVKGP